MEDVQNLEDYRKLPIERVGIKGLTVPFLIRTRDGVTQKVVSSVNFFASLPHNFKGAHMSRFVEVFYSKKDCDFDLDLLRKVAEEARRKLRAKNAYLEVSFTYFIEKQSPVSKKKSLMNYKCKMVTRINNLRHEQSLMVQAPILLLCPCSKAVSRFNAHNQRGKVTVVVTTKLPIWIEDLVDLIEKAGSSEVYALLKRSDEKYVTEKAYQNPKFVEDVVRDIALKLRNLNKIKSFSVECESFESIHNHNAYAKITSEELENKGL